MKKAREIWNEIKYIFEAFDCYLDEARSLNLEGKCNRYWARKNKRAELKELRREYRANKKAIIEKWRM